MKKILAIILTIVILISPYFIGRFICEYVFHDTYMNVFIMYVGGITTITISFFGILAIYSIYELCGLITDSIFKK